MADVRPVPEMAGAEIDTIESPVAVAECVSPHTIGGINVCISPDPSYGVLDVVASPPDGHQLDLKIGLFGNGQTSRAILYSLRRA
jgi:hypothetical protein